MKEFSVRCKYRLEPVTLQLPSLGGLLIEDNEESLNRAVVPQAIIQVLQSMLTALSFFRVFTPYLGDLTPNWKTFWSDLTPNKYPTLKHSHEKIT